MPRSGKNSGKETKRKIKRDRIDIDLTHIMAFLRFIAMMTGALLFVSLLFFIIMPKSPASNVAYTLTISINFVAFFGSVIGSILLRKKDKQLIINEQENIIQKIQKEKIEGEGN